MNFPLFFILLFLLGMGSLWIGKKASQKTKNNDDYFLAGRTLGVFPLAMTLLATQLGGGAMMGAAEEAYVRGWSVLFYPLGMVLGLLVLGFGFGAKIRKMNLTTVAELFEAKFGSVTLRKFAALLSIVSLFFILVAQAIAARKFFNSLGIEGNWLFTVFWLVLIFYTVMGGLKAVVNTDILQASFILFTFVIVIGALFFNANALPEPSKVAFESKALPWSTWLFMPLFFMMIEQDMGQRCFAAKKPRTVSFASTVAALLLLLSCLCPILFGYLAGKYSIAIPQGSSVLISSVKAFTNPFATTFLVCAVLMAIISTADSLLCSISSNLSLDFPFFRAQPIKVTRSLTFIVGMATLILGFFYDNVIAMLMFSYELSVSLLFVPIMMAIFLKNPKKQAAYSAILSGAIGFVAFRFLPGKELLTILLSLLGYFLAQVFFFTPTLQKSTLLQKNTEDKQ